MQWPMVSRALGADPALHYLAHLVWLCAGSLCGEGATRLLLRAPGRHAARPGLRR